MYNLFKLVILFQSNFIQYGAAHGWHDIWTSQQAGKMDSTSFLPCNESGWEVLNLLSSPWTPTISLEEERTILLLSTYTPFAVHYGKIRIQHSITFFGIHLRHSTYKREKYTFINANIRVINIILKIIRDNRQTFKCKRYSLTFLWHCLQFNSIPGQL